MLKAVKLGGSSLADAAQFQKCADIVKAESTRRYAVPSAPGKRNSADTKVTDMLFQCFALQKKSPEQAIEYFGRIKERFDGIIRELGLDFSLEEEYAIICDKLENGLTEEYLVSRGEYLSGKVLAKLLDFPFVDAADCVKFDARGNYDEVRTMKAFEAYSDMPCFVMPGFYGAYPDGEIRTFSRGGSDISGAIVAKAMKVDVYENWTDVSGFLAADPRIVENPQPIEEITYSELRELSYMGASVFHEEAIYPARSAGIPINIRNTNRPQDVGTWICPDDQTTDKHAYIAGIAGKKNFMSVSFEKDVSGDKYAFGRKVLQVFEEAKVMIEHVPSSVGTMTVVVDAAEISGKEESILRRIRRELDPYHITVERDLAFIAIVGYKMKGGVGVTSGMMAALAEAGISVKMVIQGIREISLIIGIEEKDFEKALVRLYQFRSSVEGK